jgi:acyl-CoA thioester hydrolase
MNQVVETTFRVRYAETDQMGIVHHASYVVWLEEGRSHWMRSHGRSYAQFEAEGYLLAVTDLQARFHQAARYDQAVTVRCWIEQVRSRQIQFGYKIFSPETGDVFVSATTRHVCLNRAKQVINIPENWQAFLKQEQDFNNQ